MGQPRFTEEFKLDAIKQITERGYAVTDGCVAQEAEEKGAHPLRSRFAVHQHGLGIIPEAAQT